MPRKTALQETERLIRQFFDETKEGYMHDILITRQPGRRKKLLAQVDMFDKVAARAYAWLTSRKDANG